MAAATTPQPFWTSKTFWVLMMGVLFNLLRLTGRLPDTFTSSETAELVNMIIGALGIAFRWRSTQPLTFDPTAERKTV